VIRLLVVLFVVSGAVGLIYESIWTRYLGLFVGHSAYAQIVVLIIFLGGMSCGALAVGRRSERIREPLLAYAVVEAIVGVLGLVFHPAYVAATGLAYDVWFATLAGSAWLPIVKWSLAGALILPQSVLLGATFPLMSAGVLRRAPEVPGRMIALLYFANSFGAAGGVLLSGFFLIAAVGLPGTIQTAAVLNLIVAVVVVVALRLERGAPASARAALSAAPDREPPSHPMPGPMEVWTSPAGLASLLLIVSFGTAVASFIYEIAWIRMLSLVLGSAARSFEVMLSAFILGLSLGALWVRTRADRFHSPLEALGLLQCAMGCLALATLPVYLSSFPWMSAIVIGLPRTDQGYHLFTLARYGICLAVMLPATFCAGTTLPLITHALMRSGAGERGIGAVYGVNTLGSILGVSLAGLTLLPWLGLKGLLIAGAGVDAALGVALLIFHGRASARSARLAWGAFAFTALLVAGVAVFVRFDPLLLTSGVYRYGILADPKQTSIVFYRHGRTASISIERDEKSQNMTLSSNGKADASLRFLWLEPEGQRPRSMLLRDECTQLLLGLVTLAHAPRARTAAVIGQGSGMTSHVLLGSPYLDSLTTVEIEPEVIRASRSFLPANRRAFEDPRSRFVVDDAKSYFAAGMKRYDLIVSEPSHPWVSGVAGLFSTEFHHRIRRHLSADGVFGQWLHLYELNDDLVLSVIAAVQENFQTYDLFLVDAADLLIVATNRPAGLSADWSVVDYPGIAADLRRVPRFTPTLLEALRIGTRAGFAPLVETGPRPNSDFFPVLDTGAEKARYLRHLASGLVQLSQDRLAFPRIASGRRVGPVESFAVPAPEIPRLRNLMTSAALRSGLFPRRDPLQVDERLPDALERQAWLAAALASPTPPDDWRAWTFEALHAEDDWHLGTAGVVDAGFYESLRAYMARVHAPPAAVEAVGFMYDVAAWRWAKAAGESDSLVARAARGEDWLPPDYVLDGAFAAKLLTGDREGARRVLQVLAPRAGREPGDMRMRLMAAHLLQRN
jgi:predicted membrane-bound spermidine synthase